ncbi:MAG: hypothetical protein V4525_00665 [Pseudomonadota bacterium]
MSECVAYRCHSYGYDASSCLVIQENPSISTAIFRLEEAQGNLKFLDKSLNIISEDQKEKSRAK